MSKRAALGRTPGDLYYFRSIRSHGDQGTLETWLAGLIFLVMAFALIWWNNPANIGSERESQRVWLAVGYCAIGLFVLVPPLAFRSETEVVAQRTLIICIAILTMLAVWWVGFLPADPGGCSRVNAPDCHTTAATRWRAIIEGLSVFGLSFLVTHALGALITRSRNRSSS